LKHEAQIKEYRLTGKMTAREIMFMAFTIRNWERILQKNGLHGTIIIWKIRNNLYE
jgi:hypothetical protein